MYNTIFLSVTGLLIVLLLTAFIISIVALVKCNNLKKTIDILTNGTQGDDVLAVLDDYYKKVSAVGSNYDEVLNLLKYHDKVIKNNLQKVYVHRYNPYKELGGNLSWVLGVLDTNNNGFIINNVYHPEGSQSHTRQITNGSCNVKLTEDEQLCLQNTIDINKTK